MFTKQLITALATMALAQEANALNINRNIEERGVHTRTHYVTKWVTVTAGPGFGQESSTSISQSTLETSVVPTPTPETQPEVKPEAQPEPQPEPEAKPEPQPETPAETPAAPAQPASTPAPAPAPAPKPEKEAETDNTASKPTTSASGGKTGKRGLAFNDAQLCSAFTSSDKISWAWNWDSKRNGLDTSIEYVPTLWGPIDLHTGHWNDNADAALAAGSTHLLSFNECDIPSQCNLSPSAAADGHVKYLNPYGDKAKIGAPSVSNSNIGGQGLDWLQEWVSVCESKGCKYDFCNVHWYSPLSAADTLYDHIKEASKICGGKPVWLTEFAPLGGSGAEASPSEASGWLGDVLTKLDALDELERYSYFMVADGKLTSGNGLSAAGEAYLA